MLKVFQAEPTTLAATGLTNIRRLAGQLSDKNTDQLDFVEGGLERTELSKRPNQWGFVKWATLSVKLSGIKLADLKPKQPKIKHTSLSFYRPADDVDMVKWSFLSGSRYLKSDVRDLTTERIVEVGERLANLPTGLARGKIIVAVIHTPLKNDQLRAMGIGFYERDSTAVRNSWSTLTGPGKKLTSVEYDALKRLVGYFQKAIVSKVLVVDSRLKDFVLEEAAGKFRLVGDAAQAATFECFMDDELQVLRSQKNIVCSSNGIDLSSDGDFWSALINPGSRSFLRKYDYICAHRNEIEQQMGEEVAVEFVQFCVDNGITLLKHSENRASDRQIQLIWSDLSRSLRNKWETMVYLWSKTPRPVK